MKKTFCFVLAVILLFSLVSCSNTGGVQIDYGESELYTMEERETVANMIVENYEEKSIGYKLKKIEFAGDPRCSMLLESYIKQDEYEGCIIFILTERVPIYDIFYSDGKIRDYYQIYVKEPDGEWYYKDGGRE